MSLYHVYDTVAEELEGVREIFADALAADEPAIADFLEQVGKFRGKMLRPVLVLLCGKLCGGVVHEHRVAGAVVEMIHMATLVHDDVLDEAETRRRGATVNALWGNETAVMLGDLLLARAFLLFSSLARADWARLLAAATSAVCEGELLQLYYRGYHALSEERYLEIIGKKTGRLMAISCELGGEIAGAKQETCAALGEYGQALGTAFQIMDDVTDLAGDERQAGKTLGTDLEKEKITLPLIYYLKSCSVQERQWAQDVLSGQRKDDIRELRDKVRTGGSVKQARQRAGDFIEQARTSIGDHGPVELREGLIELAEMVIHSGGFGFKG